jgi:hypothetical protein
MRRITMLGILPGVAAFLVAVNTPLFSTAALLCAIAMLLAGSSSVMINNLFKQSAGG